MNKKFVYIISLLMLFCAVASCSDDEPQTESNDAFIATGVSDGYEYVDLGLSVCWATCNYGAYSPSQYGDFTIPSYWGKSTSIPDKISGSDWDRLRHLMGKNWRLPTESEIIELRDNCKWKRCRLNNIEGVKITGPNGKSIFFPITGWHYFESIPWSNVNGPYTQYSTDFYGELEDDGSFDLLIAYERTYLRYASGFGKEPYFQLNTNTSTISPIRGVYSSSNPSGNSSGGNNGGSGTDHHYPCKSCGESGNCWHCNGTGTDPITHKTCNTCHGTGKCQTCNGRGYIII